MKIECTGQLVSIGYDHEHDPFMEIHIPNTGDTLVGYVYTQNSVMDTFQSLLAAVSAKTQPVDGTKIYQTHRTYPVALKLGGTYNNIGHYSLSDGSSQVCMHVDSLYVARESDIQYDGASIRVSANATEDALAWAEQLTKMYEGWLKAHDIAYVRDTESIVIPGLNPWRLQSEMGVHALTQISPFDKQKRRTTCFASVYVYTLPTIGYDAHNQKKRHYNLHPHIQITDHRSDIVLTGQDHFDKVMQGDIDIFLKPALNGENKNDKNDKNKDQS